MSAKQSIFLLILLRPGCWKETQIFLKPRQAPHQAKKNGSLWRFFVSSGCHSLHTYIQCNANGKDNSRIITANDNSWWVLWFCPVCLFADSNRKFGTNCFWKRHSNQAAWNIDLPSCVNVCCRIYSSSLVRNRNSLLHICTYIKSTYSNKWHLTIFQCYDLFSIFSDESIFHV